MELEWAACKAALAQCEVDKSAISVRDVEVLVASCLQKTGVCHCSGASCELLVRVVLVFSPSPALLTCCRIRRRCT